MCLNEPAREKEILRRKIDNGVTDMWFYINAELNKLTEFVTDIPVARDRINEMLEVAGHRQRLVISQYYN